MWISRILVAVLMTALAIPAGADVLAPRSVSLADDFVVLGAPGYCADLGAGDLAADPQVILFGSCAALRGSAMATTPEVPGLVAVSVTDAGSDPLPASALEALFMTESGRAQLARSGKAVNIDVMETRREGDMLILRAHDASPGGPAGVSGESWRALMTVDNHLITVSVMTFEDRPMTAEMALATLRTQCDRIRRANIH